MKIFLTYIVNLIYLIQIFELSFIVEFVEKYPNVRYSFEKFRKFATTAPIAPYTKLRGSFKTSFIKSFFNFDLI